MKRLVKKRELIAMDLTPLIDVIFILLIFFIVTSEFKKNESLLNLSLAKSASSVQIKEKKDVNIEISQDFIVYNKKKLTFKALEEQLSHLKKDTVLNLRIDKEVKYKRVVELLNILNILKLNNLSLITKKEN